MRKHALRFVPLLVLACVFSAAADARPRFTGTWKLDVERSDFGSLPGPTSQLEKIDQSDTTLKISLTRTNQRGQANVDLAYSLDGQESSNAVLGNTIKSTAKWDSDALLIETKAKFHDNDITLTDRWTLGEDGKTIRIARHIKGARGGANQKLVLVRQ